MKEFGVSWTIDIKAKDPKSAVEEALETIVDKQCLTFHVQDLETGKQYEVDLSAPDGEEVVVCKEVR